MRDDEHQLLNACRAGDQRAWNRLVDRFAGLVYSIARAHRLGEEACEDVAQTVFAALALSLHAIEDDSRLASWLSTTTRRECWSVAARARRAPVTVGDIDDQSTPNRDRIEVLEQHQRIRDALDQLGTRCRELLTQLYFRAPEPSYGQIAEATGIPVGSIGPTRRRCLAKLESLLTGSESAPAPDPDVSKRPDRPSRSSGANP